MEKEDVALGLSVIATLLSLAQFRHETRFKLRVNALLTGSVSVGNTVTIYNDSKRPANIYYIELAWVKYTFLKKRLPFISKEVKTESPYEGELTNITIPPHERSDFLFNQEYHFDWGGNLKESIYLKVWLSNRSKPVWFWLTGPQ